MISRNTGTSTVTIFDKILYPINNRSDPYYLIYDINLKATRALSNMILVPFVDAFNMEYMLALLKYKNIFSLFEGNQI